MCCATKSGGSWNWRVTKEGEQPALKYVCGPIVLTHLLLFFFFFTFWSLSKRAAGSEGEKEFLYTSVCISHSSNIKPFGLNYAARKLLNNLRDHYTSSTLIGGNGRGWSKFTSHYAWGTNGVCECQMDGNVYMDSYMALIGSSFMFTWAVFKNHFLEVGLTQNRETMALGMLRAVDLYYCIMYEDLHE